MMTSQTRLADIATRQKKTFLRDVVFTLAMALAAVTTVTSVTTAADAATVNK